MARELTATATATTGTRKARGTRLTAAAALAIAALSLSGCASAPTWTKPWKWFSGSEAEPQTQDDGKPYPKLGGVPDRPAAPMTKVERDQLMQGLVADRDNAAHSGDTLKPQAAQAR